MNLLRPGSRLTVLLLAGACGCATAPERRAEAPAPPPPRGVRVIEVTGPTVEIDRFVNALLARAPSGGVPVAIDRLPSGSAVLRREDPRRGATADPSMRNDWKPASLMRVEVKQVVPVPRFDEGRTMGEAAAREGASRAATGSWYEARSEVRAELLDPVDRRPKGLIEVRGEGRSERTTAPDDAHAQQAAQKALEAAAAQLLEKLGAAPAQDEKGLRLK